MRIVTIKVLPDSIPSQFEVDITNLEIGDSIHVRDLDMEDAIALDDDSRTIVTIAPPKSEALFTSSIPTEEEEIAAEDVELEEGEELEEPVEGDDDEEEDKK
jgi:large subunit ribosomal protein L25